MLYKHGLAVMRCQPLHFGHVLLIEEMLEKCNKITILLGSIQEINTNRNPFSFVQRKQMIEEVFKNDLNRITINGIKDIFDFGRWADHVLGHLKEEVDCYFCGSTYDCHWLNDKIKNVFILDRNKTIPFVSGTMLREMLQYNDERWKEYIPEEIHTFILKKYKKEK